MEYEKEMRRRRERQELRRTVRTFMVEMLISVLAGVLAAAKLVPMAYEQRGYTAVGGEWMLIIAVMAGTYLAIHNIIYAERKEKARERTRRRVIARRDRRSRSAEARMDHAA